MTVQGPRKPNRFPTSKMTVLDKDAALRLRVQVLRCLRSNDVAGLKELFGAYFDNNKVDTLGRIINEIMKGKKTGEYLSPILTLPKFVNILVDVSRGRFHLLLCEVSDENCAQFVEQIVEKNIAFSLTVFYKLLDCAERWPKDDKFRNAASHFVFNNRLISRLLNQYAIDDSKEEILSEIYYFRFQKERRAGREQDVYLLANLLRHDYISNHYKPTPAQTRALKVFGRILDGFRSLADSETEQR